MNRVYASGIFLSGLIAVSLLASSGQAQIVVIEDSPDATSTTGARATGKEAEWVWSPAHEQNEIPTGACYFRKTFTAAAVRRAEIHIAADNAYELYVNGNRVGAGSDWRAMDIFNIAEQLRVGRNTIAVKATNIDRGAAGLVARVLVQHADGTYAGHSTDETWRASVKEFVNWQQLEFRDNEWLPARSFGPLGEVLPWGNEVVLAGMDRQFKVANAQFAVERILHEDQTGSLIALCFDHRGDLLVSREGGPLLAIRDLDGDGRHESVSTFCDQLKNVQGILPVGSQTLAVGDGPDGGALYTLTDQDRDGRVEKVRSLIRLSGSTGEHGPHAVRLGPDGYLYVLVGNFAHVAADRPSGGSATAGIDNASATAQLVLANLPRTSPYRHIYEGDLLQPRYEDPRGHAVGVKAPGGTILRTDAQGSFVEIVAGGLRNPYDFAFGNDGELFTCDADMEWDMGAPWYRPTRMLHVSAGAEFGWRSGWAKWPEYFVDSLPAMHNMGPGSPSGLEVYDHFVFPEKYRGALFTADWAQGRINAVFPTPQGGTYSATSEVFLEGTPLNVTDLAVGPDGALYFCTGGRGTEGGVYRVRFTGTVPPERSQLGSGLNRALRQPQLDAPWSQAQVATIKRELGAQWGPQLEKVARSQSLDVALRSRAIELLQLYGPRPTSDSLIQMAGDTNADVRARAALLLGAYKEAGDRPTAGRTQEVLAKLLTDPAPRVRRIAAEAIVRGGHAAPVADLLKLLDDDDRLVRFAARRALERQPVETWRDAILAAAQTRVFLEGSVALLAVAPNRASAEAVVGRISRMLAGEVNDPRFPKGFISDEDFLGLLRLAQLAVLQDDPAASPATFESFGKALLREYPTGNRWMNRELVRLLVHLQVADAAPQLVAQLQSADIEPLEKLHIAAHAPRLKQGWSTKDKIALIEYYDAARSFEGGYSLSAYVEWFARDFFESFTEEEKRQIIRAGADWPSSALSVLATLPPQPAPEVIEDILNLDQGLAAMPGDPIARLKVGIVAVLARSGNDGALAYLRTIYQNEPDRRPVVAMALTQDPSGDNWAILVDSLRVVEGSVAREIVTALSNVNRKPTDAEPYRNAILLGLKSDQETAAAAVGLLSRWTGEKASGSIGGDLRDFTAWYSSRFPKAPAAELPHDSGRNKWTYAELLSFLDSAEGRAGDARRGLTVFKKAQCADCHRYDGQGEIMGPDLTTVTRRFHTKEILEAIVYPSHVIPDQYASHAVQAGGRTLVGLVAPDGTNSVVVLTSDGRKHRLAKAEIDAITPSAVSSMPENLLNPLTLQEVADLFAYLRSEARVARQPTAQTRR